jgi:predicted ATP-grasp superfamily ATP-dependent carboligase
MAEPSMNILILSGTASAINYINSLSADPTLWLHVTDTDPYCPGLYAEGVIPHWVPRARDRDQYRLALDRIIDNYNIDVVIPTSDYDVAGMIEYLHDGWAPPVALFRPPWEAHRRLAHKGRLMESVSLVLPHVVPTTWDADNISAPLPFPIVVKPPTESGGKGVGIVRSKAELPTAVARARLQHGQNLVIQQFIPGQTYIVSMVYDPTGRLVVIAPMRSQLTFFTWGGAGCAGELVDDDGLCQLCAEVVEACGGWRGPINIEWRRHEDTGQYFLLEANCRLNGYSYLTTMNGICLPRVVLSLLTGESLPRLLLPPLNQRSNFMIGFRETIINRWIEPAGSHPQELTEG